MINLILLDPTIVERTTPIPPIVWNIENGIAYEDLKYDRFDEATEFLIENFLHYSTLLRSFSLAENQEALQQFRTIIGLILRDDCSIVALDVQTRKIVGIVVMALMRNDEYKWTFWSFVASAVLPFGKVINFFCDLVYYSKALKREYDTSLALHYFIVCIARDMKGQLLKEKLMINAFRVAKSVGATVVTYVCTSHNEQERARRVGFKKIDQKNYGDYVDKNNQMIFQHLDSGEHFAELHASKVGPRTISSIDDWILHG